MRSSERIKTSIAVFAAVMFFAAASAPSFAGVVEGKAVFEAKNCSGCHETVGMAKEKTIQGRLSKKGPELWYAGDKFKKAFLDSWLKDPKPIRPFKYNSLTEKNKGDHPKLEARDALQVSDYLMSLVSGAMGQAGVEARASALGKIVFVKRFSCYGCHEATSRGNNVGGLSGPSLVNAGARLRTDWIYAYLSNSRTFKPVNDMPEYSGIMTDAEMLEAASYIASMTSPVNDRVTAVNVDRVKTDPLRSRFTVTAVKAETAKDNYRFYCAQCHGLDGKGDGPNALESMPVSPRDHTNAAQMGKLTDEDLINAITDGGAALSKSSFMPPFGKTLAKKEIIELKDYLRRLCNCKAR
ncbi:MAG: c-type cytochrome [Deltaproteobacteria bacterium]|nr:c-type cytochrome [Deltaproteobacteria bacterium]